MWGFWIVLCAAFFTEFCAAESVDLKYGQKLSIKLRDKNNTLEFTSVNRSKSCFVWPKSVQCKRGEVTGFLSKSFTISSVNFDDQGTYTQRNNLRKVISDTKVKVLPSAETQSLKIGQTLTISLSGLSKEEAGLRFSKKDVMLQGSPVPDYSKRMKVTSSSVQLLNVQVSDEGSYTLLDRKSREVKVITLKVTEFCAAESVDLKYGQKLSIKLRDKNNTLEFTSVNRSKSCFVWPKSVQCKRGEVTGFLSKSFTISSVNFDDQGTYTQRNNLRKVISDTKVKVLPSAETQSLKTGQTLTISLGGLRKDEAGLRFSNNDVNLMLVQKGSPVRNRPNYNGRIEVSSSSIQVLEVQVSDGGRYTLLDGKDREVKIITLKVTDPCASQIENMEVPYGHQLNIYLLSKIDSLGFTSVDKSQNYIIWSSSVHPKRGAVKGSGFDRNFIINSVNFEDQGDYTQSNNVRKVICVTKVKVVTSAHTQYCVAGEELTISFAGLSKDEVSLRFSKKDVNLMLVQQGSPVRNLTNYDNRIQVTSSSIQLLNVNVSDVGQYTIFDGKGREVKVISLELTEPGSWALLGIIVAVVLLCGVAGYCFKNFSTNPVQCQWQVQTTA